MNELRIGWVLPDTLNLHGERGNVLALSRYANLLGCEYIVNRINFEDEFNPSDLDIIFVPAGSLFSYEPVINWFSKYKNDIIKFIETGHPLIVTGTSVAFFGKKIKLLNNHSSDGLGIIDCTAVERDAPYGDDVYFSVNYGNEDMELIGNQIQMIDLELGDEKPFGNLIYGYGNTGKDRKEGVIKYNSIFTNSLGPLLVNNPWLTKAIVETAMKNKGLEIPMSNIDMSLEKTSFDVKREYILSKKTELRNCNE